MGPIAMLTTRPAPTPAGIAGGPDRLDAARFAPAERRRLSAPGLRTFLAIADLWGLDETERRLVLGLPPRSTFQKWARTAREHGELTLDVDVLLRISAVLGIHQALGVLHAAEHDGIAWLRRPHAATVFGGRPPIELLTFGTQDALLTLRRYLDAARGGIFAAPGGADDAAPPATDGDLVVT
ncbi:MbcA/ParS/Xre antitoxin family protein [Roseomonas sp. 18066]|uniref:MbcA/ParS/Xre antitoxin family protein n=1 Tax=Roseomonas sp. 18066 TaxID=2681412 RepID=UPI001F17CB23|nr:MbcA/ParS/Xre antitoxin family protein [Roseomonas sp. 18066]